MNLTKISYFAGSVLLMGALSISGGCGYKTNPVPPQTVVPKAIDDLRYTLDNKGAKLTWSYPLETVDGQDISDIMSFDLYRAEIPIDGFCGGCPIPFGEPLELPGGETGVEQRKTAEYVSGMLRSGNKYFFKVKSRTSWWASSADSNIVSFVFHTPAAAPKKLKAEVLEKMVKLSWLPVTTLVDGSAADLPLSYQVLKSTDGKQYTPLGVPKAKTSFVDINVQSGNVYYYKVQSSMDFEGAMVDGTQSAAVMAKVVDVVPPPTVTGVTVVASTSNVRVFWDKVNVSDLAGYRIFRRLNNQQTAEKVGEVSATQTIFIDKDVPQGTKVFYSIAAVDIDGNEGRKSEEVTTRH